jgi:hypothetical protein
MKIPPDTRESKESGEAPCGCLRSGGRAVVTRPIAACRAPRGDFFEDVVRDLKKRGKL